MAPSALQDAFAHHVWATLAVLDTCSLLRQDDLGKDCPGTYGPVLATLRHLVEADGSYLEVLSRGRQRGAGTDGMSVPELRATMEANGRGWSDLLEHEADLDPGEILTRHRPNGSQSRAPASIRLAQVLEHGSDHRSQICTALTALGVTPPDIDVWAYAAADGRLQDIPPPGVGA